MPSRARTCLIGAAAGVVAMALVWLGAHEVGALRAADASVLRGFEALRRPRVDGLAYAIATLCNPFPYVVLAAVPIGIALLRGRVVVAAAIALVLIGANETTEVLKPLLAGPHDLVAPIGPSEGSWPSGHATAVMSLALTIVLAVPARARAVVGGVMAAVAVAVCWSFLLLGWHYPSDVLGGFLVAGTWTLLAVAGLELLQSAGVAIRPRAEAATARPAGPDRVRPSLGQLLTPPLAMLVAGTAVAVLIALARPHAVLSFGREHELFLLGAVVIAALSFAFASALSLVLRESYADSPR